MITFGLIFSHRPQSERMNWLFLKCCVNDVLTPRTDVKDMAESLYHHAVTSHDALHSHTIILYLHLKTLSTSHLLSTGMVFTFIYI